MERVAVARYHYLGYKTLVGAQMRYAVHDRDGWPLAMLGFSTAVVEARPARQLHRMDTARSARRTLAFVVDNPRFLILPWINIPNLGSHILAIIRRRLPDEAGPSATTPRPCSSRPSSRPRATPAPFTGPPARTRVVSTTQGRGRYDRDRQSDKPKKDVWLKAPATGLETHPQSLKSAGANGNARADSTA